MLLFDVHLDLAMNALEWNRDLTRPIEEIRRREAGVRDRQGRGANTVCFPEMRRGSVGLCVATQIARFVKPGNRLPGWHSPAQAWAQTQGQLAWYRAMEAASELVQVRDAEGLRKQVSLWNGNRPSGAPIGYILSLEGADSLDGPGRLETAYADGLRAIGPAHYGPGTFAQGTGAAGGLTAKGRELLRRMDELGVILDATHLCDESFWEALEQFDGPIWASHSNCRAFVPHGRQFDDRQIKALIERGAVIGGVLDTWMMVPGWVSGQSTPESLGVRLEHLVNHMDHICQLAGNARHCGVGTDLDGEFGREQSPADLDTIADVPRLAEILASRGYSQENIAGIFHGNFVRFLENAWS
jgi:membrane dipeptidase